MDIPDHEVSAAFPDIPHEHDADSHVGGITSESAEAEAALEALRAAISSGVDHVDDYAHVNGQDQGPVTVAEAVGPVDVDPSGIAGVLRELGRLVEQSKNSVFGVDTAALAPAAARAVRDVQESTTRQLALLAQLTSAVGDNVDPAISFVPRGEYDELKAKYDALAPVKKGKKRAAKAAKAERQDTTAGRLAEGSATPLPEIEKIGGGQRKKRSMKLEHLVHKMANRRLGIEYNSAGFEVKGSKNLPTPGSIPPTATESLNGVQEYSPDFRADAGSDSVKQFLDQVYEDVCADWYGGVEILADEPDIEREKIREAVMVYWIRLGKRYDEQVTRERGEVHKDEITRRKQNQYRRQQSLQARRAAAFDLSPLNACKYRSLYRTILTVDFATATNDRPDPSRSYSEDEWNAYRKLALGAKGEDAHEVIDIWWMSPNVRGLLDILDVSATDQNNRIRRKGKPKAPAPTFHLPSELWNRATLPPLRQKDPEGLPVHGSQGLVLFKFHVDPAVMASNPEWAQGLYDTPPIPEDDTSLPSLSDVMNSPAYSHLLPKVHSTRASSQVTHMTPEQVAEINARPVNQLSIPQLDDETLDLASAAAVAGNLDFLSGTDGFGQSATGGLGTATPPAIGHPISLDHDTTDLPPLFPEGPPVGPAPGSSIRARKQAKRLASELPGGAAVPVAKRLRTDGGLGMGLGDGLADVSEDDVRADAAFLGL